MTGDGTPLAARFPRLQGAYEITSSATDQYNCIAWAAGDDSRCWWPVEWEFGVPLGGSYWPAGLPLTPTLANFVLAFRRQGYRECEDGALEQGFEKIAIFVSENGEPTHAARQLDDGRWTSKLGKAHDIRHDAVEGVGGHEEAGYGDVAQFMRRRIVANRPPPGTNNDFFANP